MIRYCTELQSVQYLNPHAVSVQEEEHMKKESMEVVGRIVKRERELFGIRVIKKDNTSKVRQMYPEAWHMFYLLENENNLVPPLEIQGTMEVLKNDQIRLLWFIHPIMINEWNMENCILFANEVNRELGNGGRFWVDKMCIRDRFLHVDTLLATSSVAFLLHREVSVHYQILVFSIAARNASIEILLLVSVPDSDRKS